MPPVAIGVAKPVTTASSGTIPGARTSLFSSRRSRRFLHRAESVLGLHRETVDVGAVEAGNVHPRPNVVGKDSMQRFAERHDLLAKRAKRRCSRNLAVASSRVTTLRNCVWPDSDSAAFSTQFR